jgi:Tol biopolymer transport system component
VYDLSRGTVSSVATGVFPSPASWSPDGNLLFYASDRSTRTWNLWFRRADAGGDETRLSTSDEIQVPLAITPDGRWLVYVEGSGPVTGNLLKRSPALGAEAQPLFPARAWGVAASFSPDGRWLAYESMEGGRIEIYARPFPDGETRVQLSNGGGDSPVWSQNGEVFYHAGGSVLAVGVTPRGDSLEVSKPVSLFPATPDTQLVPVFDVTPDGQRFFMLRASGRQHVSLILNWPREIDRLSAGTGAGESR